MANFSKILWAFLRISEIQT